VKRDLWISIDPGVGGSGLILWKNKHDILHHENVYGSARSWSDRAVEQIQKINTMFENTRILPRCSALVCEFPQIWSDSLSQAAANKGDICKLAACAGMWMGWGGLNGMTIHSILVNDWKGQLSKSIVRTRCVERLKTLGLSSPEEMFSAHEWDAIGLGLFHKGLFDK